MTMAATALALLLAQGQPLPPGHPPVSGGAVPAAGQTPSGDSTLPAGHPPLGTGVKTAEPTSAGGGTGALPPGHPAVSSGAPATPEGFPAGHPSVAPGASPPTSDELMRRMDTTPDLKTRPKPYEVSAAIGKLYYARARWADARDFFTQAESTAEPVRALFLQQRKLVKGELPDPSASGCRLASDMAVDKVAEKARGLAAQKQPGPAAACAREALGPVLDSTALLGNTLALIGDAKELSPRTSGCSNPAPQRGRPLRPWRGHLRPEGRRRGGAEGGAEGAPDLGGPHPGHLAGLLGESAGRAHRQGHRRRRGHEVRTATGEGARRGEAGRRRRFLRGRTADGRCRAAAARSRGLGARLAAPAQQGDD